MSVEKESPEILEYLIDLLKFRLNDSIQNSPKFSNDYYLKALKLAITAFNNRAPNTYFSLADTEFCKYHADILISYAVGILLSIKAMDTQLAYSFGGLDWGFNNNTNGTTWTNTSNSWNLAKYERDQWEYTVDKIKNSISFRDDWLKDPE